MERTETLIMPLLDIKTIDKSSFLGLWDIKRQSDELILAGDFSKEEILFFNSIKNERVKAQKICVRMLVKEILGYPKHIVYDKRGKPFFEDKSFNISISHSKNMAGVLISKNQIPGIDIEYIDNRIEKVVDKFLGKSEQMDIVKNRLIKLILYWNAKEVIYKVCSEKMLNFKQDIYIHPFILKDRGHFNGIMKKSGKKEIYEINYEIMDGYTLAWCLKTSQDDL
ncbi:MAG: hypothetical protein ABIJ97_11730 [Bacteroidota bacterium]